MKLEPKYLLKWLNAAHPEVDGLEFKLVGQCLLFGKNPAGQIVGLTVFDVRDFDAGFLEKLAARQSRPEFSTISFGMILPPFAKHKADGLIREEHKLELSFSPFIHVRCAGGIFTVRDRLRVICVDDSQVLLKLLRHTMIEMGYVEVVDQISNPKEAVETILKRRPDVITLDIQMPGMTGVDVLRDLLEKEYFPVIMVSSLNLTEGSLVFDALNSGAFDYLPKPKLEERDEFREELSARLQAAAKGGAPRVNRNPTSAKADAGPFFLREAGNLLWCIGASTGGTQALTEVFRSLPAEIPPTLVVQHIPPVFSKAFANSLNDLCPFTVKEAEHGETILPNHVYIAAGGIQMGVSQAGGLMRIELRDDEPVNRFKPSVDYLFTDVSKLKNQLVVAGILTGMGKDGAQGLLALKSKGAETFAQDEATSAVYGMPRAAVENGAAQHVAPLDQIAQVLMNQSLSITKKAA